VNARDRGAEGRGTVPRPLNTVEDVAGYLAHRFPDAHPGAFLPPPDRDVLTAWILLHAGDLPDPEAFQCLAAVQFEYLEARARALLARDCYVLHPGEVAAEALSRTWRERRHYREGLDVKHFLEDRIVESIEASVTEGRFGVLPPPDPGKEFTSTQRRWAAEAIRVCNMAPPNKRRVLHAHFFRDMKPERIAGAEGVSIGFVRDTIEEMIWEVHRRVAGGTETHEAGEEE
jgi:DNA-directed RNA polymerase specialized sigma24 family protein